ncbi:MAG: hypothetical protein WKF84_09245 [Pyrinomonadaceae bacterium]
MKYRRANCFVDDDGRRSGVINVSESAALAEDRDLHHAEGGQR